jgi:hypothetical protein
MVRCLSVGLLACFLSFAVSAQSSLEELVAEASADWMFGKWQAPGENGDTVQLSITWDLAKKVATLHVKAGDMEAKGYTVVSPKEEQPQYFTFDNKGAVGKGSWNMENDELVLRVESDTPTRSGVKTAFVFGGSASSGLEVRMHGIDGSGDLSTPARATYKFKKQT